MKKKERVMALFYQMDNIFTQNNLSIVESFRKKCCCALDIDEWEQLKRIIIWKANRDYKEGFDTKFESYLFTKAKFEVMKYNTAYRKNQKRIDNKPITVDVSYDESNKLALIETIECLPVTQQSIIIYKYYHGMTSKEICEILNIDREEYKNLMFNAINKLRLESAKGNLN
jgi:RNA polymerase sigma factor (sigma-70 family)